MLTASGSLTKGLSDRAEQFFHSLTSKSS